MDESSALTSAKSNNASGAEVCELCFGTGMEIVAGKGARSCQCRARSSHKLLLEAAHIPRRYASCSLDNFMCSPNSSQDIAFRFACRLVLDYPAVDRGLLLLGPVGVGKTHLAVAILKGLVAKGVPCSFYESGALLKRIQDSYNPISQTSELRVLAPVYQTEVLVLDELGATVPTDWVRDTMYQIINTRYNEKKLTIFTSNFSDELPAVDAEGDALRSGNKRAERSRAFTLAERIGVPLRSRLYEMCTKVVIEGEDYRKRQGLRKVEAHHI